MTLGNKNLTTNKQSITSNVDIKLIVIVCVAKHNWGHINMGIFDAVIKSQRVKDWPTDDY